MSFAREKRLLLGLLALLVPLPLPLNDAISWGVLLLFEMAVALYLHRVWRGHDRWLPNWALNLMGLVYLPLLALDILASGRAQALRPVLHLALYGLVAKLFSLRRERDKWQVTIGLFVVFLAAMATSVHPAVLLYLAVFLGAALWTLVRFAYLHLLASFGQRELPGVKLPVARLLAVSTVATLVLAAPLFALLPRVRSPFVVGPGLTGQGREPMAGFSDEMGLDGIGRIRGNREVALRVELSGVHPPPSRLRLKAATYEGFEGRSWRRAGRSARGTLHPDPLTGYELVAGAEAGAARIDLEPIGATGLPVPVEGLRLELDTPVLDLDAGGAVRLRSAPTRLLRYRVALGATPVSGADRPDLDDPEEPALDPHGVGAELRTLAREWAGEGSARDRAVRIEQRLRTEYAYSGEFVGRGGADPISDFLFRSRAGHCEYFASAMVLLLRAEGIPARLVTGFLGAETSSWEKGLIVRQGNAHAWVEGYVEGGWETFDPTPPAGWPDSSAQGMGIWLRQAYDSLIHRWDRFVLSFDFYDQVRLYADLAGYWSRLLAQLRGEQGLFASPAAEATEAPQEPGGVPPATSYRPLLALLWSLLLAAGAALAWRSWRRRPVWSATRAYRLLRQRLPAAGFAVRDSLPPLALAIRAGRVYPEVRGEIERLVRRYLEEAFAGRESGPEQLAAARAELAVIERALRRRRRARRRETRRAR
ncbi:MAG TPA: DUF3488 and transglutaminase-like domain-containing protein [Thermoanaerobaculia bacterium]|nr:DUF3488 and transglutaminase-like domain-containing protein [Thermoanaerobaculia bacterium]